MKKIILALFTCVLLTGCDKTEKLSCTETSVNDNVTTKIDFVIKNDNVSEATAIMDYANENDAKSMCDVFTQAYTNDNVVCENTKITINHYQDLIDEQFTSKSEIKEYYEERNFSCN